VGLACVIAALSVMVPDIDQSVVPSHVKDYWKQATYRRISQCGKDYKLHCSVLGICIIVEQLSHKLNFSLCAPNFLWKLRKVY